MAIVYHIRIILSSPHKASRFFGEKENPWQIQTNSLPELQPHPLIGYFSRALTINDTGVILPEQLAIKVQEVTFMKLEFITPQEAETIKRKMPKSRTMIEYEDYLKQLPDGQVGKLAVDKKDSIKANTAKARLIRASKNLKLNVQTKRVGNTVLFWRE